MGEWGSQKKAVIAGVATILLVAAVIAVAIGTTKSESSSTSDIVSTTKAVDAICSPTQYKETCQNSLAGANTTDPKKLIETAIDVAVKTVGDVLQKSSLLREVANDPKTKGAFDVCKEVLENAVDDLRRSVEKVGEFDGAKAKEYIGDLRTWLSAVVTNQETCVDAFEGTTGDAGEKMKNLLKTARELSSNGLAMVTDISEFVGSMQIENEDAGSRKLLSEEDEGFVERRVLHATTLSLKPTIVVAQDGSGQFKSINEALASLPKNNNESFIVIRIKSGVYKEYVEIPKGLNKLVFVGDGPTSTIISGDKSMAGGIPTYYTATLVVSGEDFMAMDIGVENTAGPKGNQSLAVRVSGDRAIFYNVIMDGYQDTLCVDTHRHFYRNCTISGTVDFIFGNGLALFQDCTFVVRKPGPKQACMITAQGRSDPNSNSAIIIQNGHFTAEPALLAANPPVPSYLGRPWKQMARTIIMQSDIEGFINPTGWAPWSGNSGLDMCYYAEHNNRGPGAKTTGRAKWKGILYLTPEQVLSWTGRAVYGGDSWIVKSGIPYSPTLMQV